MNKILKLITVAMISMVMFSNAMSNVYATETKTWASAKIPGSDITTSKEVIMTYYAGSITFSATQLYGDCSYKAAKCQGINVDINIYNRYVLVSTTSTPATFFIIPTSGGGSEMKFLVIMDHNATLYQNVGGKGTLSF